LKRRRMGVRRDDLGRFAPRVVPRRDDLGRFAPRVVSKKPAKKLEDKPLVKKPVKLVTKPLVKKPVKQLVKKPVKPAAKKPVKSAVKPAAKKPVKSAAKPAVKKPVKSAAKKPAKPAAKKPVKSAAKPATKKPVKPAAKPAAKKLVKSAAKKPVKLVAKKSVKKPVKKPVKKSVKKPRRRPERPRVAGISQEAEAEMQRKLLAVQDSLAAIQGGLGMSVQTFVNLDGTVDGELRVTELPDEWRKMRGIPLLVATLSNALRTVIVFDRKPPFGGAFWATFGLRFGPKNQSEIGEMVELYKRHRGLFQIGTYPTPAWGQGALQVAITGDTVGLRAMIQSLMKKRGLPPVEILIRFVWTPDGKRPAHYRGEK
jgi:hypothetical protein